MQALLLAFASLCSTLWPGHTLGTMESAHTRSEPLIRRYCNCYGTGAGPYKGHTNPVAANVNTHLTRELRKANCALDVQLLCARAETPHVLLTPPTAACRHPGRRNSLRACKGSEMNGQCTAMGVVDKQGVRSSFVLANGRVWRAANSPASQGSTFLRFSIAVHFLCCRLWLRNVGTSATAHISFGAMVASGGTGQR
jgi:hypothetical protein